MMLIVFFLAVSCQTIEQPASNIAIHPPLPQPADLRPVQFQDLPDHDGLLLTYEDYRALRHNIIEYRREIDDLRDTLKFYRAEGEK